MKIAVAQMNATVGDLAGNAALIRQADFLQQQRDLEQVRHRVALADHVVGNGARAVAATEAGAGHRQQDDPRRLGRSCGLDRHRPVVLLFATPALCQSRVCGPVTAMWIAFGYCWPLKRQPRSRMKSATW